jgi:hypothetical protein
MDELVFTNLGWPKVTFYQERAGRGRLSGFYSEVPAILIDINGSDRECQPEQSFSCPVDVSEVRSAGTRRAGTDN